MQGETDDCSDMDASVKSSESEGRLSSMSTKERVHMSLHDILTSFQPSKGHLEICRIGGFQIKLSSMEMEVKFLEDLQKILISSWVHDMIVRH
jgi:hypothetical protein